MRKPDWLKDWWYVLAGLLAAAGVTGGLVTSHSEPKGVIIVRPHHLPPVQPPPSGPAANGFGGTDASIFPLCAWFQSPSNASRWAAVNANCDWAGADLFNSEVGTFKSNNMFVILPGDQVSDATIVPVNKADVVAWSQPDEEDLGTPNPSPPYCPWAASIMEPNYTNWKAVDSTRPIILNFSQGVAWAWTGSCIRLEYPTTYDIEFGNIYRAASDICSFDLYNVVTGFSDFRHQSDGVDNLKSWCGTRPVWVFIETTAQNGLCSDTGNAQGCSYGKPTPTQVRSEIWLSIEHGATGIGYFCHVFGGTNGGSNPSGNFDEAGCLTDTTMAAKITSIDTEIISLATAINSTPVTGDVSVSTAANVLLSMTERRSGGFTYVFATAVCLHDVPSDPNLSCHSDVTSTSPTFTIPGIGSSTVTVIGESRTISASGGSFSDSFAKEDTHLYKVTSP